LRIIGDRDELSLKLVEIASAAALGVGEMLVEAFRAGVTAEQKSAFYDLVTAYDHRSEQMISQAILAQYPDSTIVGEEAGVQGQGAVHWYVDPIDGTTNFATGIPFFCVSIGAALAGQMIAGVIYDPLRSELFTASTQGAVLNGQAIRAQGGRRDAEAVLLTDFPYISRRITADDDGLFARIVGSFKAVRRLGSLALYLAYVACGRADVSFSSGSQAWDIAAGMFIVEQAGGRYFPLEPARQKPWPPVDFVATCPEFELEQSVLQDLPLLEAKSR
jgi:myo-inositol-1(or 4)-monophosphatase